MVQGAETINIAVSVILLFLQALLWLGLHGVGNVLYGDPGEVGRLIPAQPAAQPVAC